MDFKVLIGPVIHGMVFDVERARLSNFPSLEKRYLPKDFTGVIKSMQTSKQTNNGIKCSLYADSCCKMSCFGWI